MGRLVETFYIDFSGSSTVVEAIWSPTMKFTTLHWWRRRGDTTSGTRKASKEHVFGDLLDEMLKKVLSVLGRPTLKDQEVT